MKNEYILEFCSYNKIDHVVRFNTLQELDNFTMQYSSFNDLKTMISQGQRINLTSDRCRLSYKGNPIMILYSDDSFDKEEVKKELIKYLSDHPQALLIFDTVYLKLDLILDLKEGKYPLITEKQIEFAVSTLFKKDSYYKYRKAYIMLKQRRVKFKNNKQSTKDDLPKDDIIDIMKKNTEDPELYHMLTRVEEGKIDPDEAVLNYEEVYAKTRKYRR